MYRLLFTWVLRRLDAETVHHRTVRALALLARLPLLKRLLHRVLAPHDPILRVSAFGVHFPGPLGLAAGFDKDAACAEGIAALGFSHVEVGTITAHAQPGNPRPRLFRLVPERAVVNRMGFNNAGATAAARRLRRTRGVPVVVGVNIGKTKVVPESEAAADYVAAARKLAPLADYLVVNVSSPNTPGLRDLQAVSLLRPLLTAVKEVADATPRRTPLLVKIAPDLADEDVDAVAALALELGLDGIIATNTTIKHGGETGGLSARSRPAPSKCCAACAPRWATASCWCRSAAWRTWTTSGSACWPARRWCRATPAGSTAGRCGPRSSTAGWPAAPAGTASPPSPTSSAVRRRRPPRVGE
jgi:dihydroorotate dehydrogenase